MRAQLLLVSLARRTRDVEWLESRHRLTRVGRGDHAGERSG